MSRTGADAVSEVRTDTLAEFEAVAPEGRRLNGNEERPPATSTAMTTSHTDTADSFDEIDYGREFQDYLDPGYRTQEIEYKDDAPSFEQFLTHSPNLSRASRMAVKSARHQRDQASTRRARSSAISTRTAG